MSPVNEIIKGLEEMRLRGSSSLCVDPDNPWCVTFEARDSATKGEPFWIQILSGQLNMQYLDEDDPASRLRQEVAGFPPDFKLESWEACLYATFAMSPQYSDQLAVLIDLILKDYFGLQSDYDVCFQIERYG
jgi:hypothetical protein